MMNVEVNKELDWWIFIEVELVFSFEVAFQLANSDNG